MSGNWKILLQDGISDQTLLGLSTNSNYEANPDDSACNKGGEQQDTEPEAVKGRTQGLVSIYVNKHNIQ